MPHFAVANRIVANKLTAVLRSFSLRKAISNGEKKEHCAKLIVVDENGTRLLDRSHLGMKEEENEIQFCGALLRCKCQNCRKMEMNRRGGECRK